MLSKTLAIFCAALVFLSCLHSLATGEFPYSNSERFASGFLENVARINLSNYEITSVKSSPMPILNSQHNRTVINVVFSNKDHSLSAIINVVDGKFWTYNLYLLSGSLNGGGETFNSSLMTARSAIEAYTRILNANYSTDFVSMVTEALETQQLSLNTNSSMLKILQDDGVPLENTKLQWFEKIGDNFTTPARSLSLSVSKTGFISCLMDNMAIYYVASTDKKLSEEEAINISMPYVQTYALKHGQQIMAINATFGFTRDIDSLRGDSFAVYPLWDVKAYFDKINEESVSGYDVLVWADSGQVGIHEPQMLPGFGGNGNDMYSWLIFASVFSVSMVFLLVCLGTYRRRKGKKIKE